MDPLNMPTPVPAPVPTPSSRREAHRSPYNDDLVQVPKWALSIAIRVFLLLTTAVAAVIVVTVVGVLSLIYGQRAARDKVFEISQKVDSIASKQTEQEATVKKIGASVNKIRKEVPPE